jgi:RNA methyltransferase, TrmH family
VRRLATSRRSRAEAHAFVIEGPTLVADALAAGIEVLEVLYEPHADPVLLEDLARRGVEIVGVHPEVLGRVGGAVTSQGVLAVARIPDHGSVPTGGPVLVLVDVADPGNAGTLARVAEAADFAAVRFCEGSVDPWSPKSVRASAGSMLRVPVVSGGEAHAVLDEVGATGRRRVGTRPLDAEDFTAADLPADVAIVLGNEAHGLPASLDDHVDAWVRIPMAGRVESLNVAMAGTLLCFEVARRRAPA